MTKKLLAFAMCLGASTLFGMGCGGVQDTDTSTAGDQVGSDEQMLTRTLGCGQVSSFPTWSFWGETRVTVWNQNPGQGTIKMRWESGFSGSHEVTVSGRYDWKGNWAALPLYINYLSWVDNNGVEHGCEETGPTQGGAPALLVKTNT